jgi:hypothetical protein
MSATTVHQPVAIPERQRKRGRDDALVTNAFKRLRMHPPEPTKYAIPATTRIEISDLIETAVRKETLSMVELVETAVQRKLTPLLETIERLHQRLDQIDNDRMSSDANSMFG